MITRMIHLILITLCLEVYSQENVQEIVKRTANPRCFERDSYKCAQVLLHTLCYFTINDSVIIKLNSNKTVRRFWFLKVEIKLNGWNVSIRIQKLQHVQISLDAKYI